jgi:hypothetical protein
MSIILVIPAGSFPYIYKNRIYGDITMGTRKYHDYQLAAALGGRPLRFADEKHLEEYGCQCPTMRRVLRHFLNKYPIYYRDPEDRIERANTNFTTTEGMVRGDFVMRLPVEAIKNFTRGTKMEFVRVRKHYGLLIGIICDREREMLFCDSDEE